MIPKRVVFKWLIISFLLFSCFSMKSVIYVSHPSLCSIGDLFFSFSSLMFSMKLLISYTCSSWFMVFRDKIFLLFSRLLSYLSRPFPYKMNKWSWNAISFKDGYFCVVSIICHRLDRLDLFIESLFHIMVKWISSLLRSLQHQWLESTSLERSRFQIAYRVQSYQVALWLFVIWSL